jgi:hypothetical protein
MPPLYLPIYHGDIRILSTKPLRLEPALLAFLQTPKKDSDIRAQFGLKAFDSLNTLLRNGQVRYLGDGRYCCTAGN